MKTFVVFSILLVGIFCATHSKHHHHHSIRKVKNHKKMTPKALDLDNHFGYHPFASPYGPQPNYQSFEITGMSGPVTIVTNPSFSIQNIASSMCQISIQPAYEICRALNDCGMCATSPYCGLISF